MSRPEGGASHEEAARQFAEQLKAAEHLRQVEAVGATGEVGGEEITMFTPKTPEEKRRRFVSDIRQLELEKRQSLQQRTKEHLARLEEKSKETPEEVAAIEEARLYLEAFEQVEKE